MKLTLIQQYQLKEWLCLLLVLHVQALLSGVLLQPIAILLSDPVERCRVTALQLLLDAAPHLAGVLRLCCCSYDHAYTHTCML